MQYFLGAFSDEEIKIAKLHFKLNNRSLNATTVEQPKITENEKDKQ